MRRRSLVLGSFLIVLVYLDCGAAVGQNLVWSQHGEHAGDQFGGIISLAVDADGDGMNDCVASALYFDCGSGVLGRVSTLSGTDGTEVKDACASSTSLFGLAIDGRMDINSDGIADFIVGAPFDDRGASSAGAFMIYSGADGSLLREVLGVAASELLGQAVASLADLDGDSIHEYAVSAVNPSASQQVTVYSGATGAVLHTLLPLSGSSAFGHSIAHLGDANGDGISDVLVSDFRGDGATMTDVGRVYVFSGADGSIVFDLEGEQVDSEFGKSIDGLGGDLNADGCADFIVGSPEFFDFSRSRQSGKVYVYSGKDGSLLLSNIGEDSLGTTVSAAGDVNDDGYLDYLAGDPREFNYCTDCGAIHVYSGRTGLSLYHWDGATGNRIGLAIDGGADLDGDGSIEVLIGRFGDDTNGKDAGAVEARTMGGFYLDADHKTGLPGILTTLQMAETIPGNLIGLAVTGIDGAPMFAFLAIAPADGLGAFAVSGYVPLGLGGHDVDFQSFAVGFSGRVVASNVEHIEFL